MTQPQTKPYGSWQSPISADLIVAGSVGLGGVFLDRENIYWLESRAAEKGRTVLVKQTPDGNRQEVTPLGYNVRTRVHEYGGGACLVVDDVVYFSNFADQRIYRQLPDSLPQPLTSEGQKRYADLIVDRPHNRLICVCEDHQEVNTEPINTLVSIDLQTGELKTLVAGADFYSSPRLSPDGLALAWLSWHHPNLPWDGTELWIAPFNSDGTLGEHKLIAGGVDESICEPQWSADGLYLVSDRTGWWNLYRYRHQEALLAVCPMAAEFAYPHWVFGLSTYTIVNPEKIICAYTQNGRWYLAELNPNTKTLKNFDLPFTDINSLKATSDYLVFIGSSPTEPTSVVKLEFQTQKLTTLKRSTDLPIPVEYLAVPQAIAFPTDNGLTAYAWYYPPTNPDYQAREGELPPLLVKSHGGPTAAASVSFNLRIQYWTTRGFGYLDVNYRGSTGFGRRYRQYLEKNWGIVDVQDCIRAAQYLIEQKMVDPERLAISGGSAGGYTTLAALTFHDFFKAGASYYGVSDLEAIARDTHKFESRYFERLIGNYPREAAIYQSRSPIHHVELMSCPVIFFQGSEDQVVPLNQTEMMVEALIKKGLPVKYIIFEGEQHGFRQAQNIKRALEEEFQFYAQIFDFEVS